MRDQALLKWLRLRAIVNGNQVFYLEKGKQNLITVAENNPSIVITDGYHHTRPAEIVYHHLNTYYFRVECGINDHQLFYSVFLILILFTIGLATGLVIIQFLSILPILYFLYLYYINRKEFIVMRLA